LKNISRELGWKLEDKNNAAFAALFFY